MKKIIGFISCAAVAALGFSACTAEDLKNDNENVSKTVTVHFGTENTDPASTKATLTPDAGEKAFQAAWENGDEIAVKYTYVANGLPDTVPGTWDESNSKFTAKIQDRTEGEEVLEMKYQASYPYSANGYVDFGSARTQTGAAYNSVYDLMVAEPVTVTAKPGLDEKGNAIVFPMVRQTAIVYFHFTSDNTEAITKATLKVEGDGAAIAAETVLLDPTGMDYETGLSEIVLTTTGQTADDFTLWFNVLPTSYTKMSLTVETATKTFTISKASSGDYKKGKLYKVKKENITWTKTPTTVFFYESFDTNSGTGGNDSSWSGNGVAAGTLTADNKGWAFVKGYGANKCAKFGVTNGLGSATTPALGITSGTATLWFKVGAWSGDANTIVITIDGNGAVSPSEITLADGAWTEYFCTITGADADTKVKISAKEASKNRFFLDEVYVYSGPKPEFYSVKFASVDGGAITASQTSAKEGTEITLTATPDEGYVFNNDWSVKDADETEITVADSKFTMPAKDVTVSGSFSKVDYTITKETCEGGSFAVKKDGVEVTKAQIGETITLEASAAEGYEFDSWTVTNESTSKTVYVNGNTFTMPGANVTVSANFLKADVVPVYASLADLIADGAPTSDGAYVTVTLTNEEITKFFTTSAKARRGVYFTVGTREIELFGDIACPEKWVEGGWISGTLTKCKWMIFSGTWELCPTDWTELTYAAPCETPAITLNGADASITCATEGATVRYTLDETEPTETSDVYSDPVTLTDGQTIKAKAFLAGHKSSEVASKTYSAGSTGGEETQIFKWEFDSAYPTTQYKPFGSANGYGKANTSVTLGETSWTAVAGTASGNSASKGYYFYGQKDYVALQIGASKCYFDYSLRTSVEAITKVIVKCGNCASVSVKVGDVVLGTSSSPSGTSSSTTECVFSSETPLTGTLSIDFVATSSKAYYLQSIIIYAIN